MAIIEQGGQVITVEELQRALNLLAADAKQNDGSALLVSKAEAPGKKAAVEMLVTHFQSTGVKVTLPED